MADLLSWFKKKSDALYHGLSPFDHGQGWSSRPPRIPPRRPLPPPQYIRPQFNNQVLNNRSPVQIGRQQVQAPQQHRPVTPYHPPPIAQTIVQPITRAIPNIGVSIADAVKPGRQQFNPKPGIQQKILGKEPITSYQRRQAGLQKALQGSKPPPHANLEQQVIAGLRKKLAGPLSVAGTAFNAGTDATIAAPGIKLAGKGIKGATKGIKLPKATAYHASPANIKGQLRPSADGMMGPGVYLHTNPETAKLHSAMQGDGNIADQVAHKAKIPNKIYNLSDNNYPSPSKVASIRKSGYDGVSLKGGETVVFDPNKVRLSGRTPLGQEGKLRLPNLGGRNQSFHYTSPTKGYTKLSGKASDVRAQLTKLNEYGAVGKNVPKDVPKSFSKPTETKLLGQGKGITLTPGQAKQRFKTLQNRGQVFNVNNKLPSKSKPTILKPTIEGTRDTAIKITPAGNTTPIGANRGITVTKGVDKIPFTGSHLGGTPDRVIKQITDDPQARKLLQDYVIRPTDRAVSGVAQRTQKEVAQLSTTFKAAGLKGGSKEGSHFFNFVEKGGASSKQARRFLYQKVGKERANTLFGLDRQLRTRHEALFQEQNTARVAAGRKPIPHRENYITHLKKQGIAAGLDLADVGASPHPFSSPASKINPFSKTRRGGAFETNPVKASDIYTRKAIEEIGSHEPTGRLNTLIESLEARNVERGDVPQNVLNWLKQQRDIVSGHPHRVDAAVQSTQVGAPVVKGLDTLTRLAGRNLIGANPASVVTQPVQLFSSAPAKFGWGNTIKALSHPLKGRALARESEFLRGRHAHLDHIEPGLTERLIKVSLAPIEGAQRGIDRVVHQAATYRAGQLGLKGKEAKEAADLMTKETVGARGLGQTPQAYNSKLAKPVLQFSLEMGNSMHQLAADELRHGRIGGLVSFAIGSYGFNQAFNKITGRDQGVSFDPIQAGIDIAKDVKDRRYAAAAARLPGEVVANVPGGQVAAGITKAANPQLGNTLFGQAGAGRYGIGVPAVAVGQAVAKAVTRTGPIADAAAFLAPTAGTSVKRTVTGAKAFAEGHATGKKGQKTYDIARTPGNLYRSTLFGTQTTPEGKKYSKDIQESIARKTNLTNATKGDKRATDAVNTWLDRNKNKKGQSIQLTPRESLAAAQGLAGNDKAINALRNYYKGQKGHDIMWDLSTKDLTSFLDYRGTRTNDPEKGVKLDLGGGFNNGEGLSAFNKRREAAYGKRPKFSGPGSVPAKGTPKYPSFTKDQQNVDAGYKKLSDSKQKGSYIDNHPEIIDIWKAKANYYNELSAAQGGELTKDYPQPSKDLQKFMDSYSAASKAQRKSIRNSNPQLYKAMIGAYDAIDIFNINKQGSKNVYKGEPDTTNKQLKQVSGLAKDIYQDKNGNYEVDPAGWMSGRSNSSSSFNSSGGRRSGGSGGRKGFSSGGFSTSKYSRHRSPKGVKVSKPKFSSKGFKTAKGKKLSAPKGIKVKKVAYKDSLKTRKLSVSKLPKIS